MEFVSGETDAFDVIDELEVETEKLIDVGDGETVVMLLRLRGVASYTRIPIDQTWAAVWTTPKRKACACPGLREPARGHEGGRSP